MTSGSHWSTHVHCVDFSAYSHVHVFLCVDLVIAGLSQYLVNWMSNNCWRTHLASQLFLFSVIMHMHSLFL